MHDPQTVAFEIKYPWFKYRPWPKKYRHSIERRWVWEYKLTEQERQGRDSHWDEGYRETFITIWHVDPERDGSDDSCGWSYPKLTNKQKERLHNLAWGEGQNPFFLRYSSQSFDGSLEEALALHIGAQLMVNRALRLKLSFANIQERAYEQLIRADCVRPEGMFCFLAGYHTNNAKDSAGDRQKHFYGILCGIARGMLMEQRPWYRHPRWHFWHWRFQIHPLQAFKRWAFSRCCKSSMGHCE